MRIEAGQIFFCLVDALKRPGLESGIIHEAEIANFNTEEQDGG